MSRHFRSATIPVPPSSTLSAAACASSSATFAVVRRGREWPTGAAVSKGCPTRRVPKGPDCGWQE